MHVFQDVALLAEYHSCLQKHGTPVCRFSRFLPLLCLAEEPLGRPVRINGLRLGLCNQCCLHVGADRPREAD